MAADAAIRAAADKDLDSICEISNWAIVNTSANFGTRVETVDDWRQRLTEAGSEYPWLVAEIEGTVVGYALSDRYKGRCSYQWTAEVSVYLHQDHVGRGLGSALYRKLIPLLETKGYYSLIAVIARPNPASEALHARFGFRHSGTLTRVGYKFDRWIDVGYWQFHYPDKDGPPRLADATPACGSGG